MDQIPPSPAGTSITRAQTDDIPRIQRIVNAAYTKYIDRIGKPPAPMTADYPQLLTTHDIFVLRPSGEDTLVGSIVLRPDIEAKVLHLNNLVVDPDVQGRGYGRVLLGCAEDWARITGCGEIKLFTNVKMFENFGLYAKMGYAEVERRMEDGYERVYFRKELA